MRQSRPNRGLLNKARFQRLDEDKKQWLQHLSMEKAIALAEGFLSSSLAWERRNRFSLDSPVCFKNMLQRRKQESTLKHDAAKTQRFKN